MGYVLLAVSSALLLGIWKFGLSLYRGKVSAYMIIFLSAAAAGVVYLLLGTWQGTLAFDLQDAPEGLLGGVLNFTGTLLILQSFARGKVGVAVGVAAMYVLVPLGYSIYLGERLSVQEAGGMALLLVGLATFYAPTMSMRGSADAEALRVPILLAAGAALFWGAAIVILDIGSRVSVTGTLATSQLPQLVIAATVLIISSEHSRAGLSPRAMAVLGGSGVALALGNMAFFTAANEGDIGLVSVLGALSPLVTALLAAILLKERLSRTDRIAFAIVLVGTVMIVA